MLTHRILPYRLRDRSRLLYRWVRWV
jgi:hypothetical protein